MPRHRRDAVAASRAGLYSTARMMYQGLDVPTPAVRNLMALASSPRTARPVLDLLLKSDRPDVRASLAANPALPRPLFIALLSDPEEDVVEAALVNQCVPYDLLLAAAANHPNPGARELAQSLLAEFDPTPTEQEPA